MKVTKHEAETNLVLLTSANAIGQPFPYYYINAALFLCFRESKEERGRRIDSKLRRQNSFHE